MTANPRHRRRLAFAGRRSNEQGLTLIELLLSIALLGILTGFVAGGFTLSRRAFEADRISGTRSDAHASIQALSELVSSALPVQLGAANQPNAVAFDGHRESVTFVGLSEGRGLRGGLYTIVVRRSGRELLAEFSPWAAKAAPSPQSTSVIMLDGIREIRFRYYGNPAPTGEPRWYDAWESKERRPDLVSIRIEPEDSRLSSPATIAVALRQR